MVELVARGQTLRMAMSRIEFILELVTAVLALERGVSPGFLACRTLLDTAKARDRPTNYDRHQPGQAKNHEKKLGDISYCIHGSPRFWFGDRIEVRLVGGSQGPDSIFAIYM